VQQAHYRQILVDVMRDSPVTHIYVQSVLPVNTKMASIFSSNSNDAVIALDNGLKEMSGQLGVVYIDLYSSFVKDNQLDEPLTYDGLHLNGYGYNFWKQIINDYVVN